MELDSEMRATPEGFEECLIYKVEVDNKIYKVEILDRNRVRFLEEFKWQK